MLEVSTLWVEKAAQQKRIEGFSRLLAEELLAREKSVAEKRHTENAVAVKKGLKELFK